MGRLRKFSGSNTFEVNVDISVAIKLAEDSLAIVEQRLRFLDMYESTVGYVAEAIKKAVEECEPKMAPVTFMGVPFHI